MVPPSSPSHCRKASVEAELVTGRCLCAINCVYARRGVPSRDAGALKDMQTLDEIFLP